MATVLGARPSNAPLPTGVGMGKQASNVGAVVWPPPDNFLYVDANGSTGNFNRPERFWLKAGASIIASPVNAGYWTAYVYKLRLLVNGAYNNDLNGVQQFIKYNSVEAHTDSWWGTSIEGSVLLRGEHELRGISALWIRWRGHLLLPIQRAQQYVGLHYWRGSLLMPLEELEDLGYMVTRTPEGMMPSMATVYGYGQQWGLSVEGDNEEEIIQQAKNHKKLYDKLEQAQEYFAGTYANWPTMTAQQKDTAMRNSQRALSNLMRHVRNDLSTEGI